MQTLHLHGFTGSQVAARMGIGQQSVAAMFTGRQLGPIAVQQLDAGRQTLDAYVRDEWGPAHAPTLAAKTMQTYTASYGHHIGPYLGAMPLREITPGTLGAWQASRLRAGAGASAMQTAVILLGSILQAASREGKIATNPQRVMPKAKAPRRKEV